MLPCESLPGLVVPPCVPMAADGGESIGNTKPLFTPTLWSLPAPRQRPPRASGSYPSASPEHHLGTLAGSQHGWQRSESARCHSQRRRKLACSKPSSSPAGILARHLRGLLPLRLHSQRVTTPQGLEVISIAAKLRSSNA